MNQMDLKALAKINLGLDVLGKQENGYHTVRMVMQTIYLYDEVRLNRKKEPGVELVTNSRICLQVKAILRTRLQNFFRMNLL